MFELFTDRARRAIVLAQQESRREGHIKIDVGHIGLGALAANDGADLDEALAARLRAALQLTLAELTIDHHHRGHFPFTPDSKDLLEGGLSLSVEHGQDHFSSLDLLSAALTNPRVSAALTASGVDLDEIRSAILALPAGSDDLEPGPPRCSPGRG